MVTRVVVAMAIDSAGGHRVAVGGIGGHKVARVALAVARAWWQHCLCSAINGCVKK